MKKVIRKFSKDASSCFRGFSKSLTGSPAGTLKTFISPSLAGVAIMATDGAIGCGKNIIERRKIEKKACSHLKQRNSDKLKQTYYEYNLKGHGSFNRMINTC